MSWSSFASQIKQAKGKETNRTDAGRPARHSIEAGSDSGKGSASSFLSLKAELASSSSTTSNKRKQSGDVDFLSKPQRKLPAFLRPSPGVLARGAKDESSSTSTSSWASTPSAQLDAARAALERKAKIYDQLKRGKTAGWDRNQLSDSVIDWDRKGREDDNDGSEDDDRGAGSRADPDEPMVEYEDEFGRQRRVPRSEVPREVLRWQEEREESMRDQGPILYGPQSSFPVYQPPSPTGRSGEYQREAPSHFDASFEKRHRGAGFYQFSQDEETRKQEMDALRRARDETQRARATKSHEDERMSVGEQRREQRSELVRAKHREMEMKRAAHLCQ